MALQLSELIRMRRELFSMPAEKVVNEVAGIRFGALLKSKGRVSVYHFVLNTSGVLYANESFVYAVAVDGIIWNVSKSLSEAMSTFKSTKLYGESGKEKDHAK